MLSALLERGLSSNARAHQKSGANRQWESVQKKIELGDKICRFLTELVGNEELQKYAEGLEAKDGSASLPYGFWCKFWEKQMKLEANARNKSRGRRALEDYLDKHR